MDYLGIRADGARHEYPGDCKIFLIIAGGALSDCGGFATGKRENIINAGPTRIQADVKRSHRVRPVIEWEPLGGGVAVLVRA